MSEVTVWLTIVHVFIDLYVGVSTEGKRPGTEELRLSSVGSQEMPHCSFCRNKDFESIFKLCGECEAIRFCSKICQRKHWKSHRVICKVISDLLANNVRK